MEYLNQIKVIYWPFKFILIDAIRIIFIQKKEIIKSRRIDAYYRKKK
jgi:hypothetical protein